MRWGVRRGPDSGRARRTSGLAAMPLDTGSSTHMLRLVDVAGARVGPSPEQYDTLGAYLKAVREHRGAGLAEMAEITRVRRDYLQAIEGSDRAALPSRPFAIGYVRAYAQALGVEGEAAVTRFKADWPESSEPLRNPTGLAHDARGSRPLLYAGVAVLVAGVGLWNVAQRTLTRDAPSTAMLSVSEAYPAPPGGPFKVSAPLEAPAESTVPAPYVTPGMDAATAPAGGAAPVAAPPPPTAAAPAGSGASPVFTARGPVYGVPAGPAVVALQARRPVSLIVHGPDKTVYFARQLAAGATYRAPLGRGLTADVSDPAALDVYMGGRLAPATTAEPLLLDKLTPPAPVVAAAPTAPTATSPKG